MSKPTGPTTIKKYANRRLYHTGTSTYVTLEDLSVMVKKGEDFVVVDAKTNEDLTRSVLTQIIFEMEAKEGQQTLLPVAFLRQLIGYYGDQMQGLVPSYLEHSIKHFASQHEKFREHISKSMSGAITTGMPANLNPGTIVQAMQEQARANMGLFQDAFKLFNPFAAQQAAAKDGEDVEAMKRDLQAMQDRLSKLSKK
jgi:polyhydroxyalkanoate synthesis repressor PhaR